MTRTSDPEDLNLKTPGFLGSTLSSSSGPQPHPTWVYRNNYAPFNPTSSPVKRSLSFLMGKSGTANVHKMRQTDHKKNILTGIAESSLESPLHTLKSVKTQSSDLTSPRPSNMRHAVIRRHQSMYIHPRTTTEIQSNIGNNNNNQPFKVQEVSGKSEVRPIVTLQRSKTTAGSLHYRSVSVLGRGTTFNTNTIAG